MRKAYDPVSAGYCEAHISLSDTLAEKITDQHIAELKDVLKNFQPFEIEYGPLCTFPPYPGVCFDINPKQEFFRLRDAIHSTFLFTGRELKRKDIQPHMTIAEFGYSMQESEMLRDQLESKAQRGTWQCKGITLAIPDNDFQFRQQLFISLGEGVSR